MKVSKDIERRILRAVDGKAPRKKRALPKLAAGWAVELVLPCVVRSPQQRGARHWRARRQLVGVQTDSLVAALWEAELREWIAVKPVVVTLTHVGCKMDGDNLQGAFKGLRDAIADRVLCCDDGDEESVTWAYSQENAVGGVGGVRVRVESRNE